MGCVWESWIGTCSPVCEWTVGLGTGGLGTLHETGGHQTQRPSPFGSSLGVCMPTCRAGFQHPSTAGPAGDGGEPVYLDILVQAMGRQNFGCEVGGWDLKGLQTANLTLNGEPCVLLCVCVCVWWGGGGERMAGNGRGGGLI